jgi:hypothetical protein
LGTTAPSDDIHDVRVDLENTNPYEPPLQSVLVEVRHAFAVTVTVAVVVAQEGRTAGGVSIEDVYSEVYE